MPLLEVRGLEKWYGRRQVVNGVDYEVDRGRGRGPARTQRRRQDHQLPHDLRHDRPRRRQGQVRRPRRHPTADVPAGPGRHGLPRPGVERLPPALGREQPAGDHGDPPGPDRKQRKALQDELLDQFDLTKIRKTKANRVSGGERRRLEIARSLVSDPKLILLDEPFTGIDPKTVAEIQDQIRDLVETYNIGILLTDHQFRETLEVTDRSYVIREGRVFAYGNREEILNNPEVPQALHRRALRRRPPAREAAAGRHHPGCRPGRVARRAGSARAGRTSRPVEPADHHRGHLHSPVGQPARSGGPARVRKRRRRSLRDT